jgi:hypothetical protein
LPDELVVELTDLRKKLVTANLAAITQEWATAAERLVERRLLAAHREPLSDAAFSSQARFRPSPAYAGSVVALHAALRAAREQIGRNVGGVVAGQFSGLSAIYDAEASSLSIANFSVGKSGKQSFAPVAQLRLNLRR